MTSQHSMNRQIVQSDCAVAMMTQTVKCIDLLRRIADLDKEKMLAGFKCLSQLARRSLVEPSGKFRNRLRLQQSLGRALIIVLSTGTTWLLPASRDEQHPLPDRSGESHRTDFPQFSLLFFARRQNIQCQSRRIFSNQFRDASTKDIGAAKCPYCDPGFFIFFQRTTHQ